MTTSCDVHVLPAAAVDIAVTRPVRGNGSDVVAAEFAESPAARSPKSWPARIWYGLCFGLEWLLGLVSLLATLAFMAAIPILSFISLGYLLEASGRVARSGGLRDGFIDIAKFARIGSLVAGTWLCLLVPRLVTSYATDAWLIDPAGPTAQMWRVAQIGCTVLVIGHVLVAWHCGGRLRHFFWPLVAPFQLVARLFFGGPAERRLSAWFPPAMLMASFRRGRMFAEARDAVWNFVVSLRLPFYFWLGLRGFVGAILWLLVPCLMLMAGTSGGGPGTIVIGYLGALALAWVLLYLPFLQTHFARKNRFGAMFDRRAVREQRQRAPIAYWFALTVTLLFALPLYLLKIEPPPRELWWTLTIFFLVFIYPARLITGWAVARAARRNQSRNLAVRGLSLAASIPVILFYIFVLFFTQYTSYLGPASILEQHAFLVPVPFLAL